jgi:hypothetical protein
MGVVEVYFGEEGMGKGSRNSRQGSCAHPGRGLEVFECVGVTMDVQLHPSLPYLHAPCRSGLEFVSSSFR